MLQAVSAALTDADEAAAILAGCRRFEARAGEPYFRTSFPRVDLLLVERGFVVLRSAPPGFGRAIITCEAGAGWILLPPAEEEVLVGLVDSRVVEITGGARDRLLGVPEAAETLLEQMERLLSQKQEVLGNFAYTRHIERVRRRLLQLAQSYGRVAHDGILIDFPVSHTVLADMIGSSRETVTRAVDELQRRGFVARRGHTYHLLVSPEYVLDPNQS